MIKPLLFVLLSSSMLFAVPLARASQSAAEKAISQEEFFSKAPFPSMGLGSPHPGREKTVSSAPEARNQEEWSNLFSREPFAEMGLGSPHSARQ